MVLISESFSLWLQSPKKCAKTILRIFSQKVDKAQNRDLARFLGDWSQIVKHHFSNSRIRCDKMNENIGHDLRTF